MADETTASSESGASTSVVPAGSSTSDGTVTSTTLHVSPSIEVTPGPCEPVIPSGVQMRSVSRSDGERTYTVSMPEISDGGRLPLVVDLHGTNTTGAVQELLSGFGRLGIETGGWVTATPQAIGPIPAWSVPGAVPGDDLAFIEELVVAMVAEACVDPARVYAVGFSSGAAMSSYLGCASTLFTGVVPVAGVNLARRCEDAPPMSLVAFHGLADDVVPLTGLDGWDGPKFDDVRLFYRGDVRATVESWARRNDCAADPVETTIGEATVRYEWPECVDGTVVVLYLTEGAGHVYPVAASGLDATAEITAWFLDDPTG